MCGENPFVGSLLSVQVYKQAGASYPNGRRLLGKKTQFYGNKRMVFFENFSCLL